MYPRFESRLIAKEDPFLARGRSKEFKAGYQIAYGFIAHVDGLGHYEFDSMTLFDYQTKPFEKNETLFKDACNRPTFMYTMPLGMLPVEPEPETIQPKNVTN